MASSMPTGSVITSIPTGEEEMDTNLIINGNLSVLGENTSVDATITLDYTEISATELDLINNVTAGNVSSEKCLVADTSNSVYGIGNLTSTRFNNDSIHHYLSFLRSRNETSGEHTIVNDNDIIGSIDFSGSDGTAFIPAARIFSRIDGTPGTNDMPGEIVFSTTNSGQSSLSEQMRIDNQGNFVIHGDNELRLEDTFGADYIGFRANDNTSSYTLTWPPAVGGADQVLTTDSSGNLSWTTVTGVGGSGTGTITQVIGGTGISGGGTSGPVTVMIDLSEYSDVACANGDKLLTLDSDGSTEQLTTIHSLATLFSGVGLTATNSVIDVDASQTQVTAVGTLDTGAISSGFGNIDIGSSTITTTGSITGGTFVIGSASISESELEILDGGQITTDELNILDGNTSATSTTIVDADRLILNDDGIMKQIEVTDLANYLDDVITSMPNLSQSGALNSGSITSGFGDIDVGANTITANSIVGTLTGNASTATTLATARTIGGVSFDGSANINLPGVNTSGTQDTSGNASTATTLATARTIGGVSFDGSANINLPGVNESGTQDTSGNASTATTLATARTIGGVSFDGSANINLPGVNESGTQDTSGNAATATTLATARTIGGVSFDGSANINLPGVNTSGTQDTSGTSAVATTITIADEASDTSCNLLFSTAATGNLGAKSNTNLTFNSNTGIITASGFAGNITGNVTGNSDTATTLATARTIGGVSFDGSANINLPGVNTTGTQNTTGSAATLTTGRTISLTGEVTGSTTFDGSQDVSITASLNNETVQDLVGDMFTTGTYSGITVTYDDVNGNIDLTVTGGGGSSVWSTNGNKIYYNTDNVGIGTTDPSTKLEVNGTVTATTFVGDVTGNSDTATTLATARTIGGVSFDGSANINLPGVNTSGTQDTSGNAATATTLATARTIGGVSFDGSANINLPGVNESGTQNTSGNAATATTLATARTIGGVSFDGSANINLPGVNTSGTQDTSGTAAFATAITIANEATDTSCNLLFSTAATGNLSAKSNTNLTFNSNTGIVTASGFAGNITGDVTGDVTGNSATATTLATARTIGGVSFDGSANINLPGVNTSGTQDTSGTAAVATAITIADEATDTSCNLLFSTAATGNLGAKSNTNLTFNSNTGIVTASGFAGNITGNVTGNSDTATTLATARTIGGVSFDGSADINLPGVNTSGTQNTTGSAATLTTGRTISLTGEVTGSTTFDGSQDVSITASLNNETIQDLVGDMFTTGTYTGITVTYDDVNGNIDLSVSGGGGSSVWSTNGNKIYYNTDNVGIGTTDPSTKLEVNGTVTAPTFVGDVTGNSDTATALATARTIGGVSFDGSANINLPGVNTSGTQDTSGTAAVATAITIANEVTDTSCNLLFSTAASGNLGAKSNTNLTFNSNTGIVTASGFAGNITGDVTGDVTGNSDTATTLATARTIGGVSFDGSANIDLPGVNTSGTQDTSGTSAVATAITIADEATDTSCNLLFSTAAIGNLGAKSNTNLTFNSNTGIVTASGFAGNITGDVTGDVTGNSDTATTLATARTIGGVSFDGSANINLPGVNTSGTQDTSGNAATATTLTTARTIGGVSFDGSANINLPGVNTSGTQDTSGTAAVATAITIADEATDTSCNLLFSTAATGNLGAKSNTNLIFNSNTGIVTASGFSGNITGNVTGDVTGNSDTATTLATARTIGGVSFDGSANINLPGVNTSGTQDTSGNAATATTLATARTIGGVSFDGSANINLPGVNTSGTQDTSGNAATATTLATARTIGGVSFDGSANINLPGVNTSGTQDTSGTAAVATAITIADEATDTSCNVLFSTAATGNLGAKSNTNLTFNSNTGIVTAGGFAGNITGDVTGNSDTATTLATARTIGGVSFDGSANINLPGVNTSGTQDTSGNAATSTTLATARTIGGVSFDGSANINLPGVNTSGSQDTSGNAATATTLATARTIGGVSFDGSANINLPGVNTSGTQDTSGNAATATTLATARTIGGVSFDGSSNIVPSSITISDETSDETCNVLFSTDSTGDIQPKTNSGFTYNSSDSTVTISGNIVCSSMRTDQFVNGGLCSSELAPPNQTVGSLTGGNIKVTDYGSATSANSINESGTAIQSLSNLRLFSHKKITGLSNSTITGESSFSIPALSSGNYKTNNIAVFKNATEFGTNNASDNGSFLRIIITTTPTSGTITDISDLNFSIESDLPGVGFEAGMILTIQTHSIVDMNTLSSVGITNGIGFIKIVLSEDDLDHNSNIYLNENAIISNDGTQLKLEDTSDSTKYGVFEKVSDGLLIKTYGSSSGTITLDPGTDLTFTTLQLSTALSGDIIDGQNIEQRGSSIGTVYLDQSSGSTTLTLISTVSSYTADNITINSTVTCVFDTSTTPTTTTISNPNDSLIQMKGDLVPDLDNTWEIGAPDKQIKEIFVADGSLWIGDQNKISINNNQLELKQRITSSVPQSVTDAGGTSAGALSNSGKSSLSDLTLTDWLTYMRTLPGQSRASVSDIFTSSSDDYQKINKPGSITVTTVSNNAAHYPCFFTNTSGELSGKVNSSLSYNPSSGILSSTSFTGNLTGDVTGNSDTATTLATARTIGGVSFDGSANINLPGVNTSGTQDTSGNAATATALATARTIGGVSFDGSANINLPGVNTSGSQDTSGTAAVATAITIADEATDTSCNLLFSTAASGNLGAKSNTNLTFNSNTGIVTASGFAGNITGDVTGDVTGNSDTATALATARTIGGVSFDGSANINLPGVNTSGTQDTSGNAATATTLATARTIGGVSFDGSANIDLPGVNTSGSQDTSGNAATATTLATARTIGGVSFDGSANINLRGVNTSGNQDTSGNAATATTLATARTIGGVSFDGSANIDLLSTSMVVGRDSSTKIDFSSSSIISFTVGNTAQIGVRDRAILPVSNNYVDLGSSSYGFKDAYFTGDIIAGGDITAVGDITAFSTSDRNLKTNIESIENPINKLKKIGGYMFDWIEDKNIHSKKGRDIGVIAQEVEKIIPECVNQRTNGYKGVNYEKIIPLLIECIKEQQLQIDELKSR